MLFHRRKRTEQDQRPADDHIDAESTTPPTAEEQEIARINQELLAEAKKETQRILAEQRKKPRPVIDIAAEYDYLVKKTLDDTYGHINMDMHRVWPYLATAAPETTTASTAETPATK